jgi:hypothetical protein
MPALNDDRLETGSEAGSLSGRSPGWGRVDA